MKANGYKISTRKDKKSKQHHLKVEGIVGLSEISKMKTRLEKISFGGDEVIVDLNNIEAMDLSAVQLIHSLQLSLKEQGVRMKVNTEKNTNLWELLSRTGFESMINNKVL